MWHWFLHYTGSDNTSGLWYGFWSGFGSDIGEVTIIAGLLAIYRKHVCHQDGCWRISRHVVDGSPWCNKHHGEARDRTP